MTIPVSTLQDNVVEPVEDFIAQLSNPQGALLGADAVATVEISDGTGII